MALKKTAAAKKKTKPSTVDQYIASQPVTSRPVLELVRSAIRKALPKAEELISYQIPAYKLDGTCVFYFAGWKQHYSVYPVTARAVAAFEKELATRQANGKGTLKFPLQETVPVGLIGKLAKFRAREVAELKKQKF